MYLKIKSFKVLTFHQISNFQVDQLPKYFYAFFVQTFKNTYLYLNLLYRSSKNYNCKLFTARSEWAPIGECRLGKNRNKQDRNKNNNQMAPLFDCCDI